MKKYQYVLVFILMGIINFGDAQTSSKPIGVNGGKYNVDAQILNLRAGPGANYPTIKSLRFGDELSLINNNNDDWWYIDYNGVKGYVFSQYLKEDPYNSWEKKNYNTGNTPECENVNPVYDNELDNYLKINAGPKSDAVIKVMQIGGNGDICIRIAYVRSGDTYTMKNIPEGTYYLKIAYGKDYRQNIVNGNCIVKFIKNAKYEKGSDILDYYKIKRPNKIIDGSEYENWSVPSFELSLNISTSNKFDIDEFKSRSINEDEFNK